MHLDETQQNEARGTIHRLWAVEYQTFFPKARGTILSSVERIDN
jgi:hypothetical protein